MKRLCLSKWPAIVGIVTLVALATATSASGTGRAERVTNTALIEKAASAAIDSMVQGLTSSTEAPVYLRPAVQHSAAWMVESKLEARLREMGIRVVVSRSVAPPSATAGAQADTLAAGDTLQIEPEAVGQVAETMTLEYRITELGMDYPRAWRGFLIGRKKVERLASVALLGRLIEDSSGALVWSGQGSATETDVVPASELPFLEGEGDAWQKGMLPAGKLGGVVEPLVVAAIVAGLVYLFYSNKE